MSTTTDRIATGRYARYHGSLTEWHRLYRIGRCINCARCAWLGEVRYRLYPYGTQTPLRPGDAAGYPRCVRRQSLTPIPAAEAHAEYAAALAALAALAG